MNPNQLLVIDDEPDLCALVAEVARGVGFDAHTAANADEFWACYENTALTVIVLDLNMPLTDGVELLRELAERSCTARILLVSGEGGSVLAAAQRLGAGRGLDMAGHIEKPVPIDRLEQILGDSLAAARQITQGDLRQAIERGELLLHFQPKVRLTPDGGWQFVGCEALVRWSHPERGLLAPDAFIPLAEKSGLIAPLTESVLHAALDQLQSWNDAGLPLVVSVNMAPQLLNDLTWPDRIEDMMRQRGIPSDRLMLEITESGAMEDAVRAMDILTRFRLKRFGLSLDDFGTGYSSLVQLHRMPFTEIKIDKSFVMEIGANSESQLIVHAMITLAHSLGLEACAEGVEEPEAMNFLRDEGCDLMQGYLISRPVPAAELTTFAADLPG